MEKASKNVAFNTTMQSRRITLEEARIYHINYLENGPHIFTKIGGDEKIVHSLLIDREDLEMLYQLGIKGARLYFCKDDATEEHINMVAVPVSSNYEIDVRTVLPDNGVPIVNTLEPCPNVCPPEYSENDLNCRKKEGIFYWLKPNDKTQDDKVWFKLDESNNSIAVDRPEMPYEE